MAKRRPNIVDILIVCVIANMLPVPVIYFFARKVLEWGKDKKYIGKFFTYCIEKGEKLDTLTLEEFQEVSDYFHEDIYQALYMTNCVNGRKAIGGPAKGEVERQIAAIEAFVAERQ